MKETTIERLPIIKRKMQPEVVKGRLVQLKKVMIDKDWNWKSLAYWERTYTAPGIEFEYQFPDSVSTLDQAVEHLKQEAWNVVYEALGARIHYQAYTPAADCADYIAFFFDDVEWEKIALELAYNNEIQLKGRPDQQEMLEKHRPPVYGPDNLPF